MHVCVRVRVYVRLCAHVCMHVCLILKYCTVVFVSLYMHITCNLDQSPFNCTIQQVGRVRYVVRAWMYVQAASHCFTCFEPMHVQYNVFLSNQRKAL